jgi:hypothetical protein
MHKSHQRGVTVLMAFGKEWTVFPKWETLKINPESVAHFSSPENWLLKHHVYHAKHHRLTTKTPRFGTRFCQNPQQKRGNTTPKKITATDFLLPAVSPSSGGMTTAAAAPSAPRPY